MKTNLLEPRGRLRAEGVELFLNFLVMMLPDFSQLLLE
jgi:hypothetical protein